jgi:uncharacterized protein YdhG (YjbR/CyaY superfamily)
MTPKTEQAAERETFTAEERAAMKERSQELKTATRRRSTKKETREDGERDVREKIAALEGDERAAAERIHAIVAEHAPEMEPRTWYGMPAYALGGKTVMFFQPASKFKARYSTLGFNDPAQLDDGRIWPVAYAVTELTAEDEAFIIELVKRAVG